MNAKIPKDLIGIIGLKVHAKKAAEDVKEVTNICIEAFLQVYESLSIGLSLKALIQSEFSHWSWKTKISSDPIPMIISKTETCKLEKYSTLKTLS